MIGPLRARPDAPTQSSRVPTKVEIDGVARRSCASNSSTIIAGGLDYARSSPRRTRQQMRRPAWTCRSSRRLQDMTSAVGDARAWAQILGPYRTPEIGRSIFELLVTAVPFVLLWALMWAALGVGYWLCLLLALPTACFLMRLFMIQHDCGRGACFRRRSQTSRETTPAITALVPIVLTQGCRPERIMPIGRR